MQLALVVGVSHSVVTNHIITMVRVRKNQQRLIEKYLFGFRLSDGMFLGTLGAEAKGLSASTVSRLKQQWGEEYTAWRHRRLVTVQTKPLLLARR